ncbi:unnamed protein product [Ilex paraguariensis]|uniref:Uncharacterized protein n=1 Tax=Ilex paraguariensis TaxID=185542 RepID=A0ABC8QYW5_9AQUA
MEKEDGKGKERVSVLHGDGFHFNRILSRESPVGQSSRIYYRSAEGVPFKWERRPGTPKNLPEGRLIPPLSPPPAMQSLGLPRPCVHDQPKDSNRRWVLFWKRNKKSKSKKKVEAPGETNDDNIASDKFETSEHSNSEREFEFPFGNSSSCSSSSTSSSNGLALKESKVHRDLQDGSLYCSPWKIMATLVGVAKRV